MLSKLFQFVKDYQTDIILVIGVILISLLSFSAGYIVAKQQEKEPIKIEFKNIIPNRKGVGETIRFPRIGKQGAKRPPETEGFWRASLKRAEGERQNFVLDGGERPGPV